MPILKDTRREKFAAGIAAGMTQTDAYRKAGYKSKSPRQAAHGIFTNPDVKARVRELSAEIAERFKETTVITQAWVVTELVKNYRRSMGDDWMPAVGRRKAKQYTWNPTAAINLLRMLGNHVGMWQGNEGPVNPNAGDAKMYELLQRMKRASLMEYERENGIIHSPKDDEKDKPN